MWEDKRMIIKLEIPKEFENDYKMDRFRDFFSRVMADMNCVCGNYEKETAEMFLEQFEKAQMVDLQQEVTRHRRGR